MGIFNKSTSPVPQIEEAFVDKFPTWCVQHSVKLVEVLKTKDLWAEILKKDNGIEAILVDCFSAVHLIYLSSLPESTGIVLLLGGSKTISKTIDFFPQRAKKFFTIASEFVVHCIEKSKEEKGYLTDSLQEFYKSDKALEPLAVYLANITASFIGKESKEFSFSPFLIGGLYDIFFLLQTEQLNWLSGEILIIKK